MALAAYLLNKEIFHLLPFVNQELRIVPCPEIIKAVKMLNNN